MTLLRILILRLLPLLFLVLALLRSLFLSSGDSPTVVPFESATLIVLIFAAFLMPEPLMGLPDAVRIGTILGAAAIPGIPALLGGILWPRSKPLCATLIPLSYLIDLILACSLGGPVAILLDICMLILSCLVLILDWEHKKTK